MKGMDHEKGQWNKVDDVRELKGRIIYMPFANPQIDVNWIHESNFNNPINRLVAISVGGKKNSSTQRWYMRLARRAWIDLLTCEVTSQQRVVFLIPGKQNITACMFKWNGYTLYNNTLFQNRQAPWTTFDDSILVGFVIGVMAKEESSGLPWELLCLDDIVLLSLHLLGNS